MTFRAQIEARLDTGENWPGDEQVARELGCAVTTAEDYRQRWQRGHNETHKNRSGKLSPDAVDLIFVLRDNDKLSWRKVAQGVNKTFGLNVTYSHVGDVYRAGGYIKKETSPNVNPDEVVFPLQTAVGVMYAPRVVASTCDGCEYYEHCQAHPGDVCRCETAQESEMLE